MKGSRIGSNKIRIREDVAKEKMVFNQESSQAVFEMGNVQLIGPEFNAHHVYTTFSKEHFFADAVGTSDPTRK